MFFNAIKAAVRPSVRPSLRVPARTVMNGNGVPGPTAVNDPGWRKIFGAIPSGSLFWTCAVGVAGWTGTQLISMKGEIGGLRGEMGVLRGEMKKEMADLRVEMVERMASLEKEVVKEIAKLKH